MGRVEPYSGHPQERGFEPTVRYEKCLSVSSIGTLWLGRLLKGHDAGRTVLLRRVERSALSDKEVETLRKGTAAFGKVRHPTFVKLLGVVEQDADLVTVSEHLVGVPLLDLLRQLFDEGNPLPATIAVRIVLDAAKATLKAHRLSTESGLFPSKRLFLPEGVFIATFGGTLLTEVGILSLISNTTTIKTIPDVIVQLAPEEVALSRNPKGSAEVFSLGVLLWECLANRWLFSRDNERKAKSDLTTLPIPTLDTIERFGMSVPEPLVDLVKTATERNPEGRFDSVDRFVSAIEQLPAHFIATEHQVAEALRQYASLILVRATAEDSQLSSSGTFSEVPQSRVPTLPPTGTTIDPESPTGSTFDAESPTFAQRKLITSDPSPQFAPIDGPADVTTAKSATEPTVVVNSTSSRVVQTSPSLETREVPTRGRTTESRDSVESTSLPFDSTDYLPELRTPQHFIVLAKRYALWTLLLFGLCLLALGVYSNRRTRSTDPVGASQRMTPEPTLSLPSAPIAAPKPENATPSAQVVEPESPVTRSLNKSKTAPSARATTDSVPRTSTTFRPRQIAPFRPKGI